MENWHTYLTGASKERQQERRGRWLTSLALLVIGALVVTILLFLIAKGVRLFTTGEGKLTEFFFSPTWAPGAGVFGAAPMIVTSLIVTVVAGLIGLPFALAVALAVTEILPPVAKKLLQPVIELLVGIPSVVYGLVGLTVIVPAVRQLVGGTGFGLVAAVGVLYLMIMPTMTSMAIEALQAVPKQQRQASAGLPPGGLAGRAGRDFNGDDLRDGPRLWGSLSGPNGDWERRNHADQPAELGGDPDQRLDDWDGEHDYGDRRQRCPLGPGLGPAGDVLIVQPRDALGHEKGLADNLEELICKKQKNKIAWRRG